MTPGRGCPFGGFWESEGERMADPIRGIAGSPSRHRCVGARRWCLYEIALRQAIATQYGLKDAGRSELETCVECGAPYLLQEVWQPLSEAGELACPRCGAIVASWDGSRSFVAYWYRDGQAHGSK
jgi:hypothetical protein